MKLPVFLFLLVPVMAVSADRYEYWSKLNLQYSLNQKWSLGLDAQLRDQSNYLINSKKFFESKLLYSFRIWLNYKPKSTEFLLSPMAYFNSFDYSAIDHELHPFEEYRQAIGLQRQYTKKLIKLRWRVLAENRHQFQPIAINILRTRFQIQAIQSIYRGKRIQLGFVLMDEYFYRVLDSHYGFDNNRIYGGIQIQHGKHDLMLAFQWMQQHLNSISINRYQPHTTLNLRF